MGIYNHLPTYPTSARERKAKAQEELLSGIAKVLGYWRENPPFKDMTDADKADFERRLTEQADRVARMFGYDQAWVE